MTHRAHQPKRPTDTVTAREPAQRLLGEDADLPTGEELDMLRLQFRGHAVLLIPVLEAAVQDRPEDAPERVTAADVIAEVRARLTSEPRNRLPAEVVHAQGLSRSVLTLVDASDSLRLVLAGPKTGTRKGCCGHGCSRTRWLTASGKACRAGWTSTRSASDGL